ncbi:MAG: hypothetical protein M3312_10410 [Actinomycetota bacterium]|nr:hypothetical protein [Actinomycetota bacterium]
MRESGSADDLRALRNLRESLSARLAAGDGGARRIAHVVDEMIAEREAALGARGEAEAERIGRPESRRAVGE